MFVKCRRHVGVVANLFCEGFRSFELRRQLRRSEHRHIGNGQTVRQPIDQWPFGPDHHQINVIIRAEPDHGSVILRVKIDQRRMLRNPGVAGRGI